MNPENLPEIAHLAERIRAGEAEAEEELFRGFHERVVVMALHRTHDREAARDLAQETILAVIAAVREGKLLAPERLGGYVCGTARNLINNYLRTRSRSRETNAVPAELPAEDCEQGIESSQRVFLAHRAIARLRPSDRLILLLTLADGLKPREIAARLGLTPEVVRKRKSRALARAREVLSMMVSRR